uniref:Uncharacterized protein n=1 Tax=Anguilla anguilla TaxID=7936 RepID=A0A0E9XHW7_ANGAN
MPILRTSLPAKNNIIWFLGTVHLHMVVNWSCYSLVLPYWGSCRDF